MDLIVHIKADKDYNETYPFACSSWLNSILVQYIELKI